MEFCMDESCGKCIPCRAGTVQMHRLLTRISQRQASHADLEKLEGLCDLVRNTSLCGLGQSAPNPVISTLRYFRDEYEALLKDPRGDGDGAIHRAAGPLLHGPTQPKDRPDHLPARPGDFPATPHRGG
jgi:hypothetical protein